MHTVIEREIHVDASPEITFRVISSPEHLAQWWPDGAEFESVSGATGEIWFGDREKVAQFSVVAVEPPRLFSFRWCHPVGVAAEPGNSLLVTFELVPTGTGTTVRMTETGYSEMNPDIEAAEREYQSHVQGWDFFLPRLVGYVTRLIAVS